MPPTMKFLIVAQSSILFLFLTIQTSLAVDRNIGIEFTSVPESRVAPPGDWVFFNCKTNLGKGKANIKEERRHTDWSIFTFRPELNLFLPGVA